MSSRTTISIFEMIGLFIPGYKGYSDRERCKDTDKLLRCEIAKHLDLLKEPLNDIIRRQVDQNKMNLINDLDHLKRNLDIVANQIRYANHGESGFFDLVQVDIADLHRLHQLDLEIKDNAEQLVLMVKALLGTSISRQDCEAISVILSALSEKVTNRDKLIMEVR